MFAERDSQKDVQQNLKDSLSISVPYKKTDLLFNSYPKLNKLITALYIVTDIIDKEEPIRLKLRTLGAEILSDTGSLSRTELSEKIEKVFSFLDIALAVKLISEMNFNILKKEFTELSQSFKPQSESNEVNPAWLEDFLHEPTQVRQGVLNAKEKRNSSVTSASNLGESASLMLKKQRRDDIIKAIQDNGGSATIKDVKLKASGALSACGEKTLQRELVSMVKDNILRKTGEKRWSRYSLN